MYSKGYKNPQANVYNYTGLTAVTPNQISLIIAVSGWTTGKPTGLYVSSSMNGSVITQVEQHNGYTTINLTAISIIVSSSQLYVFDRRESVPSDINPFYLFIYPLKYKQI